MLDAEGNTKWGTNSQYDQNVWFSHALIFDKLNNVIFFGIEQNFIDPLHEMLL